MQRGMGFKFEENWLLWKDYEEVIKNTWETTITDGQGMESIKQKIRVCGENLRTWGLSNTKPNANEIKMLKKKLEVLNSVEVTEESKAEFLDVSKTLDDLLMKQEIYWAQRSRISWLKHGDKNSKFFHAKSSQRRRRNHIQNIKDMNGNWVEEKEDIAEVATNYFNSLFTARVCSQVDECLDTVMPKVTPNMQQILSSELTVEEIKTTLFQMGPTKTPEPDGMYALLSKNLACCG